MQEFKSFYKNVGGNEGSLCHYTARLDTYGCGCSHDCSYCYAKSLLDFRGLWHPEMPSVASVQKIRRKIRTLPKGQVIRLGGMTDCFQPYEKAWGVTYNAIQALNDEGIEYLIVTKSDLVSEDKYIGLLDPKLAHVQVSVTSTDDELSKTFEKAVVPSRRIAAIEKLQEWGIDVSLRLSPMIPQFLDMDVINAVKCDKILVEFLRVNTWIRRWLDIDFSGYTLVHAGYHHLPLERKVELVERITGFKEVTVCEDVPEHWAYWQENVNANRDDCCNLRRNGR